MIDRAYRQVLADDVRPGWLIAGPFGVATVSAVHHTVDGIDIAYRPFPRTTGNSLHFRPKSGEIITRVADDDILDRIEEKILAGLDVQTRSSDIRQVSPSMLVVIVDSVEWTLYLRASDVPQTAPLVDDDPDS